MKKTHLDIMEKALSAYTDERIRDYINEVKRDGLTEHGFPRLAANIGILMFYGRRMDLKDIFIEIMDLCCEQMPKKKAANDFSIREVCCCLMLLEGKGIVEEALIQKWKGQISTFDPWKYYDRVDDKSGKKVANWALFAAVSEFVRGKYCEIDTSEFVDWQLPSQIRNLDSLDMYQDGDMYGDPKRNPIVYDLVPRLLFAFLLRFGYEGKYRERLEQVLDNTVDITLKMQSVTGEVPFGGRSNQFLLNEALLCSYFELEAIRFKERGDLTKAGELKAAAGLCEKNILYYLSFEPIHHIKNRYDLATTIGCEFYGYFNKYMITLASNLYMGALFADETITEGVLLNKTAPYIFCTTDSFSKVFLYAGGYFLEFDMDANVHYDANGLGRLQKAGCCPVICLAVPFPGGENVHYKTEIPNAQPMALGCDGGASVPYTLQQSKIEGDTIRAVFTCEKGSEEYTVSPQGVEIVFGQKGFMLPVFEFDGEKETEIFEEEHAIRIVYQKSECIYTFNGNAENYQLYANRNGRYRVYRINADQLKVEISAR